MILLRGVKTASGPKPCRFQLYLFEREGLLGLMKKRWVEEEVEGKLGFVFLGKNYVL